MAPRIRLMSEIKNQLMRPATTSHFECSFSPPESVKEFMGERARAGAGVQWNPQIMDRINISCHDASLPGSSLQTATLTDSYTGVTENYAYRRAYDNRADFTFYVDYLENQSSGTQAYSVILFFENWISYISGEQFSEGLEGFNYFYRMTFPEKYIANKILITKFEKDYGQTGKFLEYSFINAFPISIASMPVSYDSSQVLKCTVSFSYQRYTVKTSRGVNPSSTPTISGSPPATGNGAGSGQSAPLPPTSGSPPTTGNGAGSGQSALSPSTSGSQPSTGNGSNSGTSSPSPSTSGSTPSSGNGSGNNSSSSPSPSTTGSPPAGGNGTTRIPVTPFNGNGSDPSIRQAFPIPEGDNTLF